MRIKEIQISDFKRFTNLKIIGLPNNAKLVVLVGPNGSGKTSLFEAFNHWYRLEGFGNVGQEDFFVKKDSLKFKTALFFIIALLLNYSSNAFLISLSINNSLGFSKASFTAASFVGSHLPA